MSDPNTLANTVLETSLRILKHRFPYVYSNSIARLTKPERRNILWRVNLEGTGTPDSVIVKQRDPDLFDVTKPKAFGARGFLDDWAGLEFISEVFAGEGLAPRFLGGDTHAGLFVMEDINPKAELYDNSLVDPLLDGSSRDATEALEQMMRLLGHLHGVSVKYLDKYRELRRAHDLNWDGAVSQSILAGLANGVEQLEVHIQAMPAEFHNELTVLKKQFMQPSTLTVFGHADACPDNWVFSNGVLKLIDFEFSGLMSVGVDASFARLPFPTCWCSATLPRDVIEQLEHVYREEAGHAIPEVLNDDVFNRMMADALVAWTFHTFQWSKNIKVEDQEWGINSIRARILQRLNLLITTSNIETHYPAIVDAARELRHTLLSQWGEVTLEPYDAFA
ncbi:MAG: phosphotransferase [Deinococcota bacterium]